VARPGLTSCILQIEARVGVRLPGPLGEGVPQIERQVRMMTVLGSMVPIVVVRGRSSSGAAATAPAMLAASTG